MLLSARGRTRLRLSSIEPREVTDELVGFLGKGLCRHLHIPLQSGDDAILASMKRNYTAGYYLDLINKISNQAKGIALGADVMVGFPGEGETEFLNTMRLIEQSPLSHLHVFSYSPRPGTSAAAMKHQISTKQKRERSEAILSLGMKKNMDFRLKHLNSELFVVVEDKTDATTGHYTGLTDNYIRVQILGAHKGHIGKELKICIKEVKKDSNIGIIL
jgi:threonylcarbamoyladenosine tRNA methylthiotransferase MtaB